MVFNWPTYDNAHDKKIKGGIKAMIKSCKQNFHNKYINSKTNLQHICAQIYQDNSMFVLMRSRYCSTLADRMLLFGWARISIKRY